MEKIRDIVQINSGYTSYVDLYEDYYDLVKNRGRMERYKPITAHRLAFEKIANALNPLDRRFYFLSGSYGTGKSHLLLMLANYFANPGDAPEIEAFFNNYETAQKEVLLKPGESLEERKAKSLQEARKSGCYLVAVCRYSLNLDFEGALLRALQETLQKDETSILLDTHYSEALRRIEDWKTRRDNSRFYTDFEALLNRHYSDWTINDLINGLQTYDGAALKVFRFCFEKVTDSEFTYKKDNLRDIITDFLVNPEFKNRYKGIVFLYDEFGASIDNNLVNYTTLLDFAQFCANSTLEKGGSVIFVGTGHKGFRSHGEIGDLNAETLEARVSEIGLQTQGMEDIIAAIVQPKKESPLWAHHVQAQSGKFTWFSSECNRLKLFNWLPAPKIKNNVIQNIYPMHPLATYALLKLAEEAGSDNRSVFKFFAPEFETGEQGWINVQPHSYPWFLENHEIIEHGKLSLYTADLLVDYFKGSLKASNTRIVESIKTSIINYEATLRELNAYLARESQQQLFEEVDDLMLRIIKVMLIHEVISSQDVTIANTAQNIEFALDAVSPEEKTRVEDRLKLLSDPSVGVIFNNHGVYELMRGDRVDVQRIVDQYKANPENRPTNLLDSFLAFSPLRGDERYLEAKDYNADHSEDKRLMVHFVTPTTMAETHIVNGVTAPFFTTFEQERQSVSRGANAFEGSAVYVFCENEGDVDEAKKLVSKNDQPRVVVAVPRNPIKVYDAIFTLKALESELFKKQSQTFSPFERAEEKNIRETAIETLNKAKDSYYANTKVHWFGQNAVEIPVQENKRHDVANRMMLEIFGTRRNTFGHNEFNKTHMNLTGRVRAIFIEAGDILCDITQNIRVNWSWPDNRGSTKYLRQCFVNHQALRVLSTEGDYRYLEPEKDINKFRSALPAYARLLEDLAALEGKGGVNLSQFLITYFEDFGQGEIAVTLMLLLARRFYGDSLRFKREPNLLNDIQFTNSEDMLGLVQGQAPSAVVIFEPVSEEDQAYFAKVVQIFTNQPAPAGKIYTINEAYQAFTDWWDDLPVISRSLSFYDEENSPYAESLSQAKTKDPFHFIKHDLMQLLGITPGEVLSKTRLVPVEIRLKAFKGYADAIQDNVQSRILKQIAEVFDATSHLDVDIQEAMKDWFTGLSTTQKDQVGTYHNNDSKPLAKYTSYATIRELLFITLPEAYALGSVGTWMTDFVSNYVQRVRSGKQHIETNAPQISQLIVQYKNPVTEHGNQVTYQGELVLQAETEDGQGVIYFTQDGSDPTSSKGRQKLKPSESLTIKGNRQVKLVVADESGNYSVVKTIQAIDELEKHSIKRPVQQTAFDETITFVFPKTKEAAQTTISTMINAISEAEIYSKEQLKQLLQDILDELK
jgi:hypothetical protein